MASRCLFILLFCSSNIYAQDVAISSVQLVSTSDTVGVYWEVSGSSTDEIQNFLITREDLLLEQPEGFILDPEARSLFWNDLPPETDYEVCVKILSHHSGIIEGLCGWVKTKSEDLLTENLQLSQEGHEGGVEVKATWDLASQGSEDAVGFFLVTWHPSDNGGSGYTPDGLTKEYLIQNLREDLNYTVCVQVQSLDGILFPETCKQIYTNSLDSEITDLQLISTVETISVYWQIKDSSEFDIFFIRWSSPMDEGGIMTDNGYQRVFIIRDLNSNVNYTVCIEGLTNTGEESKELCKVATTDSVEVEINNIFFSVTNTTIRTLWTITNSLELDKIRSFQVTWTNSQQSGSGHTEDQNTHEYMIDNLNPSTVYDVCIQPERLDGIMLKKKCNYASTAPISNER